MPMLDCCAPQTLDDLKAAIARGEDTIALSAEQLREWSPSIAERHDNVYHSRELELATLTLTMKAVHVVIRNQDRILLPDEILVLLESERGTIPIPIVRAHRNEPQPGDA
jgi:hypothetical protein